MNVKPLRGAIGGVDLHDFVPVRGEFADPGLVKVFGQKGVGIFAVRKSVERDVLIAYYRGEYDQAIRLANLGLPKVPESWRLNFFLGCAYAALSMLEESGTEDRLSLARESFRRARSLSNSTPIPPYISPKIIEIYKSS